MASCAIKSECIVTWGNSDHWVIRTIGHVHYCVQWTELPWVSRQTKEAYTSFYTSTRLSSFFVPYVELGSWLQGKFDLKRCDKVKKDCHFPSGSLPPLSFDSRSCNFFDFWCPVTSVLFCWAVVVFLLIIFSKRYGVYCLLIPVFLPCTPIKCVVNIVVQITPICSKVFVPWWKNWVAHGHLLFRGGRTDNGVTVPQSFPTLYLDVTVTRVIA